MLRKIFDLVNSFARAIKVTKYVASYPYSSSMQCQKRPLLSTFTLNLTHFCGVRPCTGKFRSDHDFTNHWMFCRYRHKSILRRLAFVRTPGQNNMAVTVDREGELYFGKKHTYSHTSKVYVSKKEVSAQLYERFGKNNIEKQDVNRFAEHFLRIKMKGWSRLLEERLSFLWTLVFSVSDYKKHLFNSRGCQNLYEKKYPE